MKTITAACTLIVQILILAANGVCAGTNAGATLIVCSESLTPSAQAELQTRIGTLVTEETAGHRVVVVKGEDHTPVINVSIPAGSARERLRDRTLTRAMGLLRLFLQQASQGGGDQSLQVGIPKLPATYWSTVAGKSPCKVILVGDPIFHDQRHAFWSFRNGRFPSDAVPSEPRSSCPFINRNHKKIPEDVQISILSPPEWGSGQKHRDFVIRWLRLACQESLGGKLVRVTNSSAQAFSRNAHDEFEPVKRDGRAFVGMWKLAEGATISPFPEPGVRPEQSNLGDNMKSEEEGEQKSDAASRSNAAAQKVLLPVEDSGRKIELTDGTPSDVNATHSPLTKTSDVSQERTFSEDMSSTFERTESLESTKKLDSTPTVDSFERPPTAHRPANPDDSQAFNGSSQSGNPDSQLIAGALLQDVEQAVGEQSKPEMTQTRQQIEGVSQKQGDEGVRGEEVLPTSVEANVTVRKRKESEMSETDVDVVLERINAICRDQSFPAELVQLLTQVAPREQPNHAVVATWTSNCPHADLNLHIADVAVRRDVASSADGTARDRIEWGITSSLDCDSWINIYETHRDVRVAVVVIDLKSGRLHKYTKNIGAASDHGRDIDRRSKSNSWHKVTLNASR